MSPFSHPYAALQAAWPRWREMGASSWVLDVIANGIPILWASTSPRLHHPGYPLKTDDTAFMAEQLERDLAAGYIKEVTGDAAAIAALHGISPSFIVRKVRKVLNYTHPNANVDVRKFKYETLHDLFQVLRPDDPLLAWDVKDAYQHLLLREEDQRYLSFTTLGRVFIPITMPFGMSLALYVDQGGPRAGAVLPRAGLPHHFVRGQLWRSTSGDARRAGDGSGRGARLCHGPVCVSRVGPLAAPRQGHPRRVDGGASTWPRRRHSGTRLSAACHAGRADPDAGQRSSAFRVDAPALGAVFDSARLLRHGGLHHTLRGPRPLPSTEPVLFHGLPARAQRRLPAGQPGDRGPAVVERLSLVRSHARAPILAGRADHADGDRRQPGGVGRSAQPLGDGPGCHAPDRADLHINLLELGEIRLGLLSFRRLLPSSGVIIRLKCDSKVALGVLQAQSSPSVALMAEYRLLHAVLEELKVQLRHEYIQSALNLWAERLYRAVDSRPTGRYCRPPSAASTTCTDPTPSNCSRRNSTRVASASTSRT
eukprot:TRINITY_DN6863_c0_g1_i1.p1 TRINITY_DN6863_c0_g1~~TRINITY_DN6863_c0_g1_i1.p1  ORF type:complete len:538 (+),score=38.67 TRINITY_DN6863_c0_g1_i1:899-2512(+)